MKKFIKLAQLFVVYHAANAALVAVDAAHRVVLRFIAWAEAKSA